MAEAYEAPALACEAVCPQTSMHVTPMLATVDVRALNPTFENVIEAGRAGDPVKYVAPTSMALLVAEERKGARVKAPLALVPVEDAVEVVDTVSQHTLAIPLENDTPGEGLNGRILLPFEGGVE